LNQGPLGGRGPGPLVGGTEGEPDVLAIGLSDESVVPGVVGFWVRDCPVAGWVACPAETGKAAASPPPTKLPPEFTPVVPLVAPGAFPVMLPFRFAFAAPFVPLLFPFRLGCAGRSSFLACAMSLAVGSSPKGRILAV
jgi:hypothetical protein